MEFSAESLQKINGLSMAVLNKPSSELTKAEAEKIIAFDMLSLPTELVVTINDTRRTEQQYCTNSYGGSMKASLSGITQIIGKNSLEAEDVNTMLNTYLEEKMIFLQLIKCKYASMEKALRDLSRDAQVKDKIVSIGRYADN